MYISIIKLRANRPIGGIWGISYARLIPIAKSLAEREVSNANNKN
jgi:hypothetical protein